MLTQLDAILKRRLALKEDFTADDDLITGAINAFTDRFENECNRKFARMVDWTYEFAANEREVIPDRYPVESVSLWHVKTTEAEGWVDQGTIDYVIREKGAVLSLGVQLGGKAQLARVTFTGGFVLPGDTVGAGQTALPNALQQACIEQVAYWYQRRHQLGLVNVSAEGGSISQFAKLDLLPSVVGAIQSYKRYRL